MNNIEIRKELNKNPPEHLVSSMCSQAKLESHEFIIWTRAMHEREGHLHRKLWEWCYISQALFERGFLEPGMKGLGFAVGQEPLPALLASFGAELVASDLDTEESRQKGWVDTDQHAAGMIDLNNRQLCPEDLFQKKRFRFVDMNNISEELLNFDFVWSSCSLEHLGTLQLGEEFIMNSLKCLKPGGLAVHTTEYNISSNFRTIKKGQSSIYRKRDLKNIGKKLQNNGHKILLDFAKGNLPSDRFVDKEPYTHDPHLRLILCGYVVTSFGLIIQKSL